MDWLSPTVMPCMASYRAVRPLDRQFGGRLPRAEMGGLDDLVGSVRPQAVKGAHQELPDRPGIGFVQELLQFFTRYLACRNGRATVGQRHFDLKRIAAIDSGGRVSAA